GRQVCRSSCVPTVASLSAVEQAALAGAPEGTRLAVIFEPTGPAWLPIAVFFARRGHAVYRVSSAKTADLRRFLRRHAKSNGIDAETLARLPLAGPRGLAELEPAVLLVLGVGLDQEPLPAGVELRVELDDRAADGEYTGGGVDVARP
ncbi:MAG TPA: hypothetical protein VLW50_31830, partial [Streptosporangiaceae bacterium]|nr:hypothetical protein [Streptosporangiaceae bacterium]